MEMWTWQGEALARYRIGCIIARTRWVSVGTIFIPMLLSMIFTNILVITMAGQKHTTNRAPWLYALASPLNIVDLSIPEAIAESVVIKVLSTVVVPYAEDIHSSQPPIFNLSLPLVPHPSHVGRVSTVGLDSVFL